MAGNSENRSPSSEVGRPEAPPQAASISGSQHQLFSDRFRMASGVIAGLTIWVVLLITMPGPVYALVAIIATVGAVSIVAYPQVGLYLLAFLLIGQWPWNIITYLGMLTIVSTGFHLILHQKRLFPPSRILWLTGVYLMLVLASAISPQTDFDLRSQIISQGGHCALVWVFVTLVDSRERVFAIVRLMIASGVITSIIGLVQWRTHFLWITSTTRHSLVVNEQALGGASGFELQQWGGQFRIDSITGTPDYLPLYLQCLLPFVAFWVVRERCEVRRLSGIGVLLLFGFCHLLSYTRGALLTTGFVLLLTGWIIEWRRVLVYTPILALLGMVTMLSWGPWRERLVTMISISSPESGESENTGMWRLRTIPVGIEMILQRPVSGVGIGQQKWNWPKSTYGILIPDPAVYEPPPIHNDYLRVGIDLGLGGIVVLLLMLTSAVRQMYRTAAQFRLRSDRQLEDVALALMIATVGISMAMLLYPIIDDFRYFWLLIGLAAALVRYENETHGQALSGRKQALL